MIAVTVKSQTNHVRVNLYTDIPLETYLAAERTTNSFDEYLPAPARNELANANEYLPLEAIPPAATASSAVERRQLSTVSPATPAATVNEQTTSQLAMSAIITESGYYALGQFDFPGQRLLVDGQPQPHRVDTAGRITTFLNPGEYSLTATYTPPPIIIWSRVVSILGGCILLLLVGMPRSIWNQIKQSV